MEARDGSLGFDFEAVNTEIIEEKEFTYEFSKRTAGVEFKNKDNQTEIIVVFDPENQNSIEMQKDCWQKILNNFKQYTENN